VNRLKPEVDLKWLILTSGALWSGVGIMLVWMALHWLSVLTGLQMTTVILGGLVLGALISRFGFLRLARKNTERIWQYKNRACFFAFQRWQSYQLIVVMMSMGIFMRTSHLIPRQWIAPLYIGIGSALFVSSLFYYRNWKR